LNLLRNFSFLVIFCLVLFSDVKNFDEIKNQPKGLAKDYYIYRLISEGEYTKEQIKILNQDVYRRSPTLNKVLNKIIPQKSQPSECGGINTKNILQASLYCQKKLLTIVFSSKLTSDVRAKLALKFDDINTTVASRLRVLNTKYPADEFAYIGDTDAFLAYYNVKKDSFNKNFNESFVNKIASKKAFEKILNDIVINKQLDFFRQSLLQIIPENTSNQSAFLLGINAILFKEPKVALEFFTQAAATAKKQSDKDEATFWCYLITKDKIYLNDLNQSSDINIYTLYANELTNQDFPVVFSPIADKEKLENYDIKDPFLWQKTYKFLKDINASEAAKYAPQFKTKETLGHYAYFMERASGYKDSYYVMPFIDEFNDINASRKTMIYALGRQESRFIPAVISTSYALGMMQFMPFLANHIGKKELQIPNFDQDDMFDPRIAIRFANHHLDYLEKFLYHPLFIAYAYNGGIGFTKKTLQRGDLFNNGEYEPFLSMELIPYAESRDYGKKVLSNYVIYSKLLHSNTSILKLFEILKTPALTDKFRK